MDWTLPQTYYYFGHCLLCSGFTNTILETWSISIIRCNVSKVATQLDLLERASINHWTGSHAHMPEDSNLHSHSQLQISKENIIYMAIQRFSEKSTANVLLCNISVSTHNLIISEVWRAVTLCVTSERIKVNENYKFLEVKHVKIFIIPSSVHSTIFSIIPTAYVTDVTQFSIVKKLL
jgi:hypothetical protein